MPVDRDSKMVGRKYSFEVIGNRVITETYNSRGQSVVTSTQGVDRNGRRWTSIDIVNRDR